MITRLNTLVLLILLTVSLPIQVVQITASSASVAVLDPSVQNVQRWDNAWTSTFLNNGSPPFKTIIYSEPQVVWNDTHWVRYDLKTLGDSIILRTPKCTYVMKEDAVLLFDPNFTMSHVGKMEWNVEQYSLVLDEWSSKNIVQASIGHNASHVWQKWVFADDSERIMYIGADNKQTVMFKSKSLALYRLSWRFVSINATGVTFANGTHIELSNGFRLNYEDFRMSKMVFFENERVSLLIDFRGISESQRREFRLDSVATKLAKDRKSVV